MKEGEKMAELPEIAKLTGQMRNTLRGKTIERFFFLLEKCNVGFKEYPK